MNTGNVSSLHKRSIHFTVSYLEVIDDQDKPSDSTKISETHNDKNYLLFSLIVFNVKISPEEVMPQLPASVLGVVLFYSMHRQRSISLWKQHSYVVDW